MLNQSNESCNECGGQIVDGTCHGCGLVFDKIWSDKQIFKEKKSRCRGESISDFCNWQRMWKTGNRRTWREAAITNARETLEAVGISAPIILDALELYQKVIQSRIMVGKSASEFLSVCVLVASRRHNVPYLVKDAMTTFDCSRHGILRAMGLMRIKIPPVNLKRLIIRFYEGHVPFPLITKMCKKIGFVGKHFQSVVPQVKCALIGKYFKISNAADLCGVREISLKKYLKTLVRLWGQGQDNRKNNNDDDLQNKC